MNANIMNTQIFIFIIVKSVEQLMLHIVKYLDLKFVYKFNIFCCFKYEFVLRIYIFMFDNFSLYKFQENSKITYLEYNMCFVIIRLNLWKNLKVN